MFHVPSISNFLQLSLHCYPFCYISRHDHTWDICRDPDSTSKCLKCEWKPSGHCNCSDLHTCKVSSMRMAPKSITSLNSTWVLLNNSAMASECQGCIACRDSCLTKALDFVNESRTSMWDSLLNGRSQDDYPFLFLSLWWDHKDQVERIYMVPSIQIRHKIPGLFIMVVISSETIPLGFKFIQSFLTKLQAFHISMHCFWIQILIASPAKSNHKPHDNFII